MDLKDGGMGGMFGESGGENRIGRFGDELQEVQREELTMQRVRAILDEVSGS